MSDYIIYEEECEGYTIKIMQDNDVHESPRDWDNLGRMVCSHRDYILGDEKMNSLQDYLERNIDVDFDRTYSLYQDRYLDYLYKRWSKDKIVLPLYLYDHGGITMNTTGFSCRWDSGQIGFIYVSLEDVRKKYNVRRVTKKIREKAAAELRAEVATYDDYLTGNVWRYVIEDKHGDHLDSCWGFFGDYKDDCLIAARSVCKHLFKENYPLCSIMEGNDHAG